MESLQPSLKNIMTLFTPLAIYIFIATIVYFVRDKKNKHYSSLISYYFPPQCYWTKSAGLDLFLSLLNGLLLSPLFLIAWAYFLLFIHFDNQFAITANNLSFSQIEFTLSHFLIAIFIFVIADGVNTFQHYLSHRIPFLWQLHKVHHSAPTLNLLTADRHHPLSFLIATFLIQATVVMLIYLFQFLMGAQLNIVMIWAMTNLMGALLKPIDSIKHTHIWISLGPLNYILQSPAMHQMHHSIEPKYHHKNFATFFSFWDLMLGTLYIPKNQQEITYGLKKSDETATYEK